VGPGSLRFGLIETVGLGGLRFGLIETVGLGLVGHKPNQHLT